MGTGARCQGGKGQEHEDGECAGYPLLALEPNGNPRAAPVQSDRRKEGALDTRKVITEHLNPGMRSSAI